MKEEAKSSQEGVANNSVLQASLLNQYLNEENLKHLDRISGCVKLNYSKFIKRMIRDQEEETDDCSQSLPQSKITSGINSQKSSAAKS